MKYDLTIVYAPGIQIPVCLFFQLYIQCLTAKLVRNSYGSANTLGIQAPGV